MNRTICDRGVPVKVCSIATESRLWPAGLQLHSPARQHAPEHESEWEAKNISLNGTHFMTALYS